MRFTLAEVAAATGGEVHGDPSTEASSFTIDSRQAAPGALFVAVKGGRDGHDFVGDAFERGAVAALVERVPEVAGFAGVRVAGTVEALAELGGAARHRLADARVVAVTGSTGKTSTKDLTAAALATRYDVVASPASFNNELGVPLTLLAATEATGAVVAEIGARGAGEVAAMASVVRHHVGVVTTIGAAHTERFGSLDEVARAKAELLEMLPPDGTAVVGTGHAYADFLVSSSAAPVLTVGSAAGCDVRVSDLEVDGQLRPSFHLDTPWGSARVRLEMRGAHQAGNAALAVAAAVSAGAGLEEAVAGLAAAEGSRWRMEVETTASGVTVLNDAYNANPDSMEAALEALAVVDVPGRRWAVVGEMAELGARSVDEHRRLGGVAAELGVDRVVVVGAGAGPLAAAAREAGCTVDEVARSEDAVSLVTSELRPGDAVLVKASRVVGLERVAEALLA